MRYSERIALCLAVGVAACAQAGGADAGDDARIERVTHALRSKVELTGQPIERYSLAQRMAHYKVPGLTVAVIDSGRIAWAKGFGVKVAGTTDSVTPQTLFEAGSISKPVAQTAMLKLVERGTLALDTDVNQYLKSWKVPENKFTATEKVTLRRIASHSAGLTIHGFPGYEAGTPIPTLPQVLDGTSPANTEAVRVDTTPGAIWRYSGGGTTVMQLLLADVTGKPFPQLLRELVLGPAGMTSSTYEQPLPEARWGEAAHAHDIQGEQIKGQWHVYPEMAAAGLWTTPTDLAKWALAIADARAGKPGAILSKPIVDQMLTVQKGQVGLGPFLGGSGRSFHFGHDGSDEGMHAQLIYYPETGQGIAIMTNGDGGPGLMNELAASVAEEYHWPERPDYVRLTPATIPDEQLDAVVGGYTIPVSPKVVFNVGVRRDGHTLVVDSDVLNTQELVPQSATSFVLGDSGDKIEAVKDASGKVTALRLFGIEAKRVR